MNIDYENELKRMLKTHPTLNHHGLGYNRYGKLRDNFEDDAGWLEDKITVTPDDIEMFAKCYDWLSTIPRQKTVSPHSPSSYGLKHVAEPYIGYSTNGIFIAAALALNFKYKEYDSPNPCFNISKRTVDNLSET